MKSLSLLLAVISFDAIMAHSSTINAEWESYKMKYGKSYDENEEPMRIAMYLKKSRIVQEHNASNKSWTMQLNFFSDMTEQESMRLFTGAAEPSTETYESSRDFEIPLDRQTPPKQLDLRTDPCIPPIKAQDACGSCYAFSAMTPIEYQNCKKNGGKLTTFSEQQIVDCSIATNGCYAGLVEDVWQHQKSYGVFTEAEYPYREISSVVTQKRPKRTVCPYCTRMPSANSPRPQVWGKIVKDDAKGISVTDAMILAINKYGPISVFLSTYAPSGKSINDYEEGIYDEPSCTISSKHAVVIIGYGTDDKTGLDYWIARNSAGTLWAPKMGGNFLIRRGVNRCGIETYAYYVSLD